MRTLSLKLALAVLLALAAFLPALRASDAEDPAEKPRIQIALLLDTSGSMDGLIGQAKTQLWKIVNEFISAKRNGKRPEFEVALFEYGNDGLKKEDHWIRLVVPLTNDLDKVSQELFALKTNGGEEYCGAVIQAATERLAWSKNAKDLKTIYIAGNEPFSQGPVKYQDACRKAIEKGITINTIFCGPLAEGAQSGWKDGAALADGAFINIDQNRAMVQIDAPQDKEIAKLNEDLNKTYIAYGKHGAEGKASQAAQEVNAASAGQGSLSNRALTKSSPL